VPLSVDAFSERLLAWYAHAGRALPWRRTRDPYAILVSEVMLQQTQVERVIPRWEAWLERWPTPSALAEAPRSDLIAAWRGLGDNRRAVALHETARILATEGFPSTPADWRRLPGVGPYTADAICALALGHDVIPLDVNVRRVLERALGVASITPPPGTGHDLTQALFDLGATVCLARIPRCEHCPLADACPSRGRRFAPTRRQSQFEGSRRQARGRLVDRLREGPVALTECDPAIAEALVSDGLAERRGSSLVLPTG
jgi:A/G-specific adenine glycosylase